MTERARGSRHERERLQISMERERGRVQVPSVGRRFGVSMQTLRKDLELRAAGEQLSFRLHVA